MLGARRMTLVQVSTLIDPHAKVQDRGGRRPAGEDHQALPGFPHKVDPFRGA